MAASAPTIKRLSLELGGNAPLLVFDDADLDAAVDGAIASKFRNTGQTCVCANRLLVQDGIHDAFVERLSEAVRALAVGNGFDEGVEQGPLIDDAAVAKVEEHIADALAQGAAVATGGSRHALGGTFFEPTVLTGATGAMRVANEETFGPLAPIFRFTDETEAIALANATEFGLAAYLFTRDVGRVWRVGEALEFGIVGVNTGIFVRGRAVRRRQAVRHRARGLAPRDRRVPRGQVPLPRRHRPLSRACPCHGDCRPAPRCVSVAARLCAPSRSGASAPAKGPR
jgi:succinate-semialdehyde dehydrogenase/glutarate-semialdehyde dehydrogenase